jgi:hypothetical protein
MDSVTGYDMRGMEVLGRELRALLPLHFLIQHHSAFSVAYPDQFSATITSSLDSQTANAVFAGPASGSATAPLVQGSHCL